MGQASVAHHTSSSKASNAKTSSVPTRWWRVISRCLLMLSFTVFFYFMDKITNHRSF